MANNSNYDTILKVSKENNKFFVRKPENVILINYPSNPISADNYTEAFNKLIEIKNKQIFTSYKDYYLYILQEKNKFVIRSGDRAFIEYYVGIDTKFSNINAALDGLTKIRNLHNLERFDRIKNVK